MRSNGRLKDATRNNMMDVQARRWRRSAYLTHMSIAFEREQSLRSPVTSASDAVNASSVDIGTRLCRVGDKLRVPAVIGAKASSLALAPISQVRVRPLAVFTGKVDRNIADARLWRARLREARHQGAKLRLTRSPLERGLVRASQIARLIAVLSARRRAAMPPRDPDRRIAIEASTDLCRARMRDHIARATTEQLFSGGPVGKRATALLTGAGESLGYWPHRISREVAIWPSP